ncbi:hypothetical protein EGW08_016058, partial [Elysia chlorotica]
MELLLTPHFSAYKTKPWILLDYKFVVVLLCYTVIHSVIYLPGANGYTPGANGYSPSARSFFHRYHDSPVRLSSGGHVITSTLDGQGSHYNTVTAEFTAFGKHFVLDLSLNRQLISGAFVQKVFHGTNQHSSSGVEDVFHSRVPHT